MHDNVQCQIQFIEWLTYTMTKTYNFVFKNLEKAATSQKKYYDVGLKVRQYTPGQFVWRWYPPYAVLKLGNGWTGPYKVVQKLSSVSYDIQRDPKTEPIVVHVDDIKPYLGQGTPLAWCDSSEGSKSVNHNTAVPNHTESQSDAQAKEPEPYRT